MRIIRLSLVVTITFAVILQSSIEGTFLPPIFESNRFSTDLGGGGYQEAKSAPALAPATLFAAVALAAIIALVIKNEKDHGHGHAHSHI